MGNQESSSCSHDTCEGFDVPQGIQLSPENLQTMLGDTSTEHPDLMTPEEQQLAEKLSPVFDHFHKDPTLTNYQLIRSADSAYEKALGDKYQLYIWALRDKYAELNDALSEDEKRQYTTEEQRLMRFTNKLSARDLDKLWALFYATGDRKYPDRINLIINDAQQHFLVRQAALWSYNDHQSRGELNFVQKVDRENTESH